MRFRRLLLFGCAGVILLLVSAGVVIFLLLNPQPTFVNAQVVAENRLAIPPLLEPHMENGEKVFDLTLQKGETEFFPGKQTQTAGFNGSYLGPTLRAHTGDKVRINVTNSLGEATTVHWHGMHLPAVMDGGPHQVIQPGETWHPYWTVTNQASTLWYHPHPMGKTGEQVYSGLAGLFLIDDANSDSLAIPNEYGVDDIPLIVQDRKFDASGQLIYQMHGSNENLPPAAGMLGDTILVNGTRAPYVEVPQKLIRLRVLNASNGRRYNFGFSDNRPFYQIATDGGMLDSPVERTRMLLAPAERAEILVDLSNTKSPVTLMSYEVVDNSIIFIELAKQTFGGVDEHQQFKILELRPKAGKYPVQEIPQKLNTIKRLNEASAVKTRLFTLGADTINDKLMDETRIDEVVKKGDIEIWEIHNQSPLYHPFHIHGVQFLILDRNGQPPPPYERGWKDTVSIEPAETVRVILQFTEYSDPHMPYMFHCHILEHEDMGMMGQFVVVDSLSDKTGIDSPQKEAPDHNQMQH